MSVGLLDFFVLEASDYVDRLQRLVATDEAQGPDSATLLKLSRELRGSAAMARLGSFAEAAAGVERAARLLNEGRIAWTPLLATTAAKAIAELRALIPMARLWGESQDERARSTGTQLTAVLDEAERRGSLMQSGATAGPASFSVPTVPNPAVTAFFDSIDHAANALVAAPLSPQPPPVPHTPSPLPPTPVGTRAADSFPVSSPPGVMAALTDALMPIVPIATLAPGNGADAVVFRAPNPPVAFGERFISDITPLIGSLRARLAPLRQGAMQHASADMVAAFRPILTALREISASYEQLDISDFCDAVLTAQAPLPAPAAGALDTALTVMLQQDIAAPVRSQRLAELRRVVFASTPLTTAAQSEPASRATRGLTPAGRAPMNVTIIPTPTVARPTPPAPRGRELNSLLTSSLQRVRELDATPLDLIAVPGNGATATPVAPGGEPDVVPIDSLLYRGSRALSRARHIVGHLRGNGAQYDAALIDELLDLVELSGSAS